MIPGELIVYPPCVEKTINRQSYLFNGIRKCVAAR